MMRGDDVMEESDGLTTSTLLLSSWGFFLLAPDANSKLPPFKGPVCNIYTHLLVYNDMENARLESHTYVT